LQVGGKEEKKKKRGRQLALESSRGAPWIVSDRAALPILKGGEERRGKTLASEVFYLMALSEKGK